jgi:hypothetical protein
MRLRGLDLLLLGAFPLYLLAVGNGFLLSSGDNLPARHLPSLVVQEGSLDLSKRSPFSRSDHYSVRRRDGGTRSALPIGTPLLAVPYAAAALGASRGEVTPHLLLRWEKHFSALLAVASACLLFAGLRHGFGTRVALATTVVFAIATPFFTHNAQAMWSTTGEVFCLCGILYLALKRPAGLWPTPLAGALAGLAFLCRPTAMIPLAVLAAAALIRDRRAGLPFAIGIGVVVGAVALAQQAWLGHPLGGHGLSNAHSQFFDSTPAEGLLGGLVSPSRGMLVFMPFLALVPFAGWAARAEAELRHWWWASLAAVLLGYLLAMSYFKWWGGHCIGPRAMVETAPFLALLTLPFWRRWGSLQPWLRSAFVVSLLIAGATQVAAAYTRRAFVWNAIVDVDLHSDVLWSWRNSQLAAIWRPGWSYRLDPEVVEPVRETGGDPERWHRVDLAGVANARFDADPFRPGLEAVPRFGRLDPRALNLPGARFHFAARGLPNAITTCSAEEAPEIPIPELRAERIHAILSARWPERDGAPVIGRLRVNYADATVEELPIRLNRDVFRLEPSPRRRPVPPDRIYFGDPEEMQVLVASTFSPNRPDAKIVSLQPRNLRPSREHGIAVLALTLELAPTVPSVHTHRAMERSG